LVGKPDRVISLGRFLPRGGANIIMDLKEIGWNSAENIHLARGRYIWLALGNTVMNILTA
jgi:hypothetical protein